MGMTEDMMVILGIDPGFAITGYGIIVSESGRLKYLDCGVIETKAGLPLADRLAAIYDGLQALITIYKPDAAAIEELFFNTNAKTALTVGHGRGVAILAAAKTGTPVFQYTPLQVKQAVTAYGRAEKRQVQQMVKVLLGLPAPPKPDDAADALAVAICHANSAKMNAILKGNGAKT
jgi:crossover junction endodeoxyribonuclease RuvC